MNPMKPGVYNFEAKQSDWALSVNWVEGAGPQDLTGFTARLVVRYKVDSATVVLECTQASGITLGGSPFNIVVRVPKATMMGVKPGQYVYDLELKDADGNVYPLLTGRVTVPGSTVPLLPTV